MPRIREIKPEFFLDEQLAEVSHAARLLFIGLWILSDREGRLEDRPARIKAQVFPYGQENVDALLTDLAIHEGRFVIRYEAEGRAYLQVRSFEKHQRPHPKETKSKLPAPPPLALHGRGGPTDAVKLPGKSLKETASPETPADQVDPSGGSMGTLAHGSMGTRDFRPAAGLVPAVVSWSKTACDDWIDRYGGTAPGGQIGKALKPLVEKHGWPAVRQAWRSYLEQSEAEYASASRFAATFGRWSGAVAPAKPKAAAVLDNNRAVLAEFVKGGAK